MLFRSNFCSPLQSSNTSLTYKHSKKNSTHLYYILEKLLPLVPILPVLQKEISFLGDKHIVEQG